MTEQNLSYRHTPLSRRSFVSSAGVAGLAAVAGCLGDDGEEWEDEDGMFRDEITVTHWPDLMYNGPYHVAIENGYFEDEGLELGIVGSEGGGTTVRNILEGGLPFAEVSTPAAVNAYQSGSPITIIAPATRTVGDVLWVTPVDSDIESIEDLIGESAGFTSAGSVTETTLALVLEASDEVDIDDIDAQAMGGVGEGLTAAESGDIAAAANLEPTFSSQQLDDEPWRIVIESSDYVDLYQQTVLIADPDVIEARPEVAEGLIQARANGAEFVAESPDETAEIFSAGVEGFDEEVIREAIENTEPSEYYATGGFDVEGLQNVDVAMRAVDLIDEDEEIPWDEIIDQSYLPEDEQIDIDAI